MEYRLWLKSTAATVLPCSCTMLQRQQGTPSVLLRPWRKTKVSAALSDLADDLKQAELEAKTWVCTDPDTCQWRRQVGGTRYELYDIFEAPNGTYFVVHGEVDPTELDPDDYDQLLEAYSGLLDSANCESERWALIAEAQFETEELDGARTLFNF